VPTPDILADLYDQSIAGVWALTGPALVPEFKLTAVVRINANESLTGYDITTQWRVTVRPGVDGQQFEFIEVAGTVCNFWAMSYGDSLSDMTGLYTFAPSNRGNCPSPDWSAASVVTGELQFVH
jgi:hypothetical protein